MTPVSEDVLSALSASRLDGNKLHLAAQLPRDLYTKVAKVIVMTGGKWDRKTGAHIFPEPAADAIEPILLTGEVQNVKQDFGQFDSPPEVVARLILLADLRDGMTVYEPSCGIGNILAGIRKISLAMIDGLHYFANELDPKRFQTAREKFFIAGGISNKDFLQIKPVRNFDRIVMNPPFAKQADIDHVLHAAQFLKEGGRLVSVMSPGFQYRQDRKASVFRSWFSMMKGATVEALPPGSFKASGTGVSSVIIHFNA